MHTVVVTFHVHLNQPTVTRIPRVCTSGDVEITMSIVSRVQQHDVPQFSNGYDFGNINIVKIHPVCH